MLDPIQDTMRKFGFGKKDDDGDSSNRLALFGSRPKSKSPAPSANPYAQPALANDPYTQAKAKAYGAPPPAQAQGGYGAPNVGGYRDEKSNDSNGNVNRYGAAPAGTTANNGGGYGADKFSGQSGYGGDRFGSSAGTSSSRYGAGGYGGLGGVGGYDTAADENRDALFGGAKDRVQQKTQQQAGYGQPPPYEDSNQSGVAEGQNQGYGRSTYGDRQLTAEEEEEEDVSATKQQIQFMKREDVSSTRNALRIAQQAEETGRDTLARLGAQGEHIHNTEKNLDLAHNQNRMADDKAKELKTINRSMFAVHVSNPFTGTSRREARDQAVIDRHLDERDRREATRKAEYNSSQRLQKSFKELQPGNAGYGQPRGKNLAERAKYQFEADSDDEEMENEIDSNLDALGGAAGRLNALARATGQEVDEQNKILDRVSEKVWIPSLGIPIGCTLMRNREIGWTLVSRKTGRSWIGSIEVTECRTLRSAWKTCCWINLGKG